MFKRSVFFIILLISFQSIVIAQEVNAYDDQGKRHGLWQKKYKNSKQLRYTGTFDHGKEIGVFKFYDQKGGHPTALKTYTSNSDMLDVVFYTTDGKKVSEGKMKGRDREGKWITYHQDGTSLMITSHYQKGLLEGLKEVYYIDGTLAQKETYVNGKKDGVSIEYTKESNILRELNYKDDKLEGFAKMYNGLGILEVEGFYKNNRKHGMWKYYKNGKLEKELKFPQNKIGVQ